jgi:hypothetical protein
VFPNCEQRASGLLWQNDDGRLAIWQSNGSNGNPFAAGIQVRNLQNPGSADWHVVAANDFDGNGAADIVLQHTDGRVAIWEMQSVAGQAPNVINGGQFNVAGTNAPGFSQWDVVGTGDINGDFRAGIVFQNNVSGAIAVWEQTPAGPAFNGTFQIQSNLPNPGTGWHVEGMGNTTEPNGLFALGDDLVLQRDDGLIAIWQLQQVNATTIARVGSGFNLGNPGDGWDVVAVRDMNNDGRADIVLQHDNGAAKVWDNIQPNGTHDEFFFTPQPNPNFNPDWHIA